jgi:hypothetical protein
LMIMFVMVDLRVRARRWISLQAVCNMMLVSGYGCDCKSQSIPA